MIARETATEIVLHTADSRDVSIPVRDIVRRTSVGSLMPAGLLDTLVPEERFDLIKFVSQLGKPGEFDAAKGGVARAWRLYLVLSQNQHLGVERVVAGAFSLKDWVPMFSLASGVLAKEALEAQYPNRGNTRGLFAATRVEAARDGTVRFTTRGEVRGAWVNGAVVPVAAGGFSAPLRRGTNTIVLQLNDTQPTNVELRSGEVTFLAD